MDSIDVKEDYLNDQIKTLKLSIAKLEFEKNYISSLEDNDEYCRMPTISELCEGLLAFANKRDENVNGNVMLYLYQTHLICGAFVCWHDNRNYRNCTYDKLKELGSEEFYKYAVNTPYVDTSTCSASVEND